MKSSNIGGQAVLEGIMMRNGGRYSVAVRKTDGEIAVDVQKYHSIIPWKTPLKIPFIRGIFNFVDSLVLGMRTLMYSASFFEEEEGEEEAEEESYVIGFSAIDMENPYFITLESAAREALEAEGCQMITKDPGTDPDLQASQIQEMIDEGIDAILLTPVNWEKITPSLQALQEAGVKILNVDAQVKEMDYVDAYIGSDNYTAGQLCGEDLMEKQPEGGKIAILECPTQNSVNDRITGFEETIADAENGFEVVARADTGGQFERALEETQEILKEFPDLTAIMCGNDQMAVGAKTAVNR